MIRRSTARDYLLVCARSLYCQVPLKDNRRPKMASSEAANRAEEKGTALRGDKTLIDLLQYWAVQKDLVKGCRETLDCYCVSCELLSASIADTLLFVNILVSGIFYGRFAKQLAVNKPCLQIIKRLLWKQTTTHCLRNNNPMFDGNLCPLLIDQPSMLYLVTEG